VCIIIRKWLLVFCKEAFIITSLFVVCVKDSSTFFLVFLKFIQCNVRIFTRSAIISALVSDVAWKITCFHVLLYVHISHTLHTIPPEEQSVLERERGMCIVCSMHIFFYAKTSKASKTDTQRNSLLREKSCFIFFFLVSRFVLWASDSLSLHTALGFSLVCVFLSDWVVK